MVASAQLVHLNSPSQWRGIGGRDCRENRLGARGLKEAEEERVGNGREIQNLDLLHIR